ncbi:MAG: nucleoside kinase, partial [Firmicutes bacterium]|nr:nucleoside kinase [Bacillota bacterium]
QKIAEIAEQIKASGKKVILISGPSSSGKTTFAYKLRLHLKVLGRHAYPVSLDDYYIEKCDMPKNQEGKPDYEALESIDYKRFNENIADLTAGRETSLPGYDFTKSAVIKDSKRLKLEKHEMIIVEGIHGLNPKIAENIGDNLKYKIYCTPLMVLNDNDGKRIPSRSTRIIRRLVRDTYFRNTSYTETFDLWGNQEIGSQKNVFPYTDSADVLFNSSLLYEYSVYKKHLLSIFKDARGDNKYITNINALRDLVNCFSEIDDDDVPKISLVREFIGGSTLY